MRRLEMKSRHATRFGWPLSPSGALYAISDEHGLVKMEVDIRLIQRIGKSNVVTEDTLVEIKREVLHERTQYHRLVNQFGIPEKLKTLFGIKKKSEVEKYCRDIVVSEYELFLLIHNCSQLPMSHRSKFREYMPEHLKVSTDDRLQMKDGISNKFIRKLHAGLSQRKYIHVHLFEFSTIWHCFFFSHNDTDPTPTNHWKQGGCHVHYVSYLWPELNKRWIWNQFNKRSIEFSGSVHLRFEPFDFSKADEMVEVYRREGKTIPWAFPFDPALANGMDTIPLPVPHLATRGIWAAKALPPKDISD
jgi:hypothetical protein